MICGLLHKGKIIYVPERDLILVLLNHENYKKYHDLVDLNGIKDTHKELWFLYHVLFQLHKDNPDKDQTLDTLHLAFYTKYPEAKQDIYTNLFKTLQELRIDPGVGEGILKDIKRRTEALERSEAWYRVASGVATDKDQLIISSPLGVKDGHQEELTFVTTNLEELLEQTIHKQGVRWRLNCLNKSLGSLRPGDFGFIFARPETGKTTFLASEISFFLTQTNKTVVWLNNEEQGQKVMLRVYQAFFGITLETLMSNPRKYREAFEQATQGRFLMLDRAHITHKMVERVVSQQDPSVVVYDQIDKIKGFDGERDDLRLGTIYQWARELAKDSHAAIGICQADGTAEGQRYLHMGHVANAKTSKQAEADFIFGIGKIHDDAQASVRFLNVCKNKLMGDKDRLHDLMHGQFEVLIDPMTARYKDIITYA